jgi:hypothetical protein
MLASLKPSRRTAGWVVVTALAVALGLLAVIPETVPGMTRRELDLALTQLSSTAETPTYYLGDSADGLALDMIAIPPSEEGNVQFLYGPCQQFRFGVGDEGGCPNPVMVMTDPWNPIARTCQLVAPVLGVPAAILDDGELELFTGALRVHVVDYTEGQGFTHAARLAHAVRAVGATRPVRLPPPTPTVQRWIDSRCHR